MARRFTSAANRFDWILDRCSGVSVVLAGAVAVAVAVASDAAVVCGAVASAVVGAVASGVIASVTAVADSNVGGGVEDGAT